MISSNKYVDAILILRQCPNDIYAAVKMYDKIYSDRYALSARTGTEWFGSRAHKTENFHRNGGKIVRLVTEMRCNKYWC